MMLRFDGYEIDLKQVEIRKAGAPVLVQPQVFAVIEYLVEHRDRVVTKEELLDQIWGDRFVSESALTSRIKSARRALGDSGARQAVIRTVQGRGYRFVADVLPIDNPQASAAAPRADRTGADRAGDDWPLIGRYRELAEVGRAILDVTCPGIVVTGPEHIGTSRFASACMAQAEVAGSPTAHVVGLTSGTKIPLAAMSHLLPQSVLTTEQFTDDLARADVHRRALRALQQLADSSRLVMVVRNGEALDSMSSALIATATLQGFAFVVLVRDQLFSPDADASQERLFREIRLRRLDETDVDILLHRVLGGPIAPGTLQQLVALSDGRPGLLRDIVETSQRTGALVRDHGVWRLIAPPASTSEQAWDPAQLSPLAIHAVEVLSLLGRVSESMAIEQLGEQALDELDKHHLIAVDEGASGAQISMDDPLLAAVVAQSIGPLRERRLKRDLTATLLSPEAEPSTIATLAGWSFEAGDAVDDSLLLGAAQTAMIVGDMATAGRLVELTTDRDVPAIQLIDAEVSLRRSQWKRAEGLFEALDVSSLDDISASHVLRRRAAIQFYSRARYVETIDWLKQEADARGGRSARALRARRVGMLAYLGRVDDTLEAAAELGDLRGLTAIEVLLSTGSANLHRGAFDQTLEGMDAVDLLIDDVPEAWADEPRDGVLTLRGSALLHLGHLEDAAVVVRAGLPLGERTALGYLPSLAAMIELYAGRPRAAREFVRQAVESSHREEFPHYRCIAEAVFARTDIALGYLDDAATRLEAARAARASVSGELDWLLSIMIAQLAAGLGQPDDPSALMDLADDAAQVGAFMREADLRIEAALYDPSRRVAQDVTKRVSDLVDGFDGAWWPVRAAHLRAVADGASRDEIGERYRALGFHGLAETC